MKNSLNIIGRAKECTTLREILSSKEAEFLAVYGRRRVGKTFLIDEFFKNKGRYLSFTGLKDASLQTQLRNFADFLTQNFHPEIPLKTLESWKEAFSFLMVQLEALPQKQKIILFLDEIPWIATKRSKFIQTLDYFWNTRLSKMPNLKLIVCGSAASWMLDNLIYAKGGLYNRLSRSLLLLPFNLRETRDFLNSRGVKLKDKGIADLYLAMGGVPHYLKQVKKGRTAIQNINDICFQKDGLLYGEFPNLFRSLFDDSEVHLKIARALAGHNEGLSSLVLAKAIGQASGGTLSKKLVELEASGIIRRFVPYGRKIREHFYRLTDEYCLFYLSFIEPLLHKGLTPGPDYWQLQPQTPRFKTWAGYAFENVCYKHANQILMALDLGKIPCEIGTWRSSEAQIDLLFDRSDGAISLCEIKYSENLFTIDKAYAMDLHRKVAAFEKFLKGSKQIFLVLICATGLKQNLYAKDLVPHSLTLSTLFD